MVQQTDLTPIQWITLSVYLLVVVIVLLYEAKRKTNFSAVPFLIVGLHGALFYLLLHFKMSAGFVPPWHEVMNFTVWSSVLRMHGAMTIAAVFAFETHEQIRLHKLAGRVKRRHALE